jgi:hypothetical protein
MPLCTLVSLKDGDLDTVEAFAKVFSSPSIGASNIIKREPKRN